MIGISRKKRKAKKLKLFRHKTLSLAASVIACALMLGGFAQARVFVPKSHNTAPPQQDTVGSHHYIDSLQPSLVIQDSLRATYKYTDGLRKMTIHGDSTAAERLFLETLEIDSTYAPAMYQLASHYMERDPQKAHDYAHKAYRSDTTSRWYATLYGQSLLITRRYDEALPIFRTLMRRDRNNPEYYRITAMLYQQRQQPFSAISILDSADMQLGKVEHLAQLKRHLLISTNQFDRAIEEAQALVDAAPYDQSAVLSLGETYAAAGKDSLARLTMQQAIKMDSTNITPLAVYADFCLQHRDTKGYLRTLARLFAQSEYPFQRKVDMFEQLKRDNKFYGENYFDMNSIISAIVMTHPNEKRAIDLYGEHLIAGGNVEAALSHFKFHLADTPPQMDYYIAVIDIEEYLQHPDSVDYYVQRAVEQFPDNPVLYIRKANRQYLNGDLLGAIKSFESAIELSPTDSLKGQIWGYIGDTYHAIAEKAEAGSKADTTQYKIRMSLKKAMKQCYAAYDQTLALWGENASVLNNYAYFLSEEDRDLERALGMSKKAIEIERNNSTFIDSYAWILYKLDRFDEARNYMRQALSLDRTKSAELPLHYGDILFALGEKFMAETYWQKALELGADKVRIEERLEILKTAPPGAGKIENLLKGKKK